MSRLKRWLLPVFTLLLAAAGAAMPFAAAWFQDAQQSEAEIRPFDSFSLTLKQESDLSQVLRMIAGLDYYIQELELSETATLTQTEALEAAENVMAELLKYGLLEKQLYENLEIADIWPQTVAANDGSAFIATWSVQWDAPGPYYIWMDDATGKAFMINLYAEPQPKDFITENIYAQMDAWRVFLEDYYGVEVQILDEIWYNNHVEFTFSFPLGAGEDQEFFQMTLYMYFESGFTTLSPYVPPRAAGAAS